MDKSQLEPDLIQVFRLYIVFRLILVGLTSLVAFVRPRVQVEPGTFFSLVELTLLLIYLSIPWFHNKLGRWFLPLALAAATLGPIVEVTLGLQRPLLARTTGAAPAADVWQVTVLLTLPLFLVAWQYNFDTVIGFTAGVAILEFSFNVARALLFGQDALLRSLGAILLRSAIFLLEGAVVTRLMAGQRQQRQVLKDANRQLARYASTMEQLAASRERNRLARELHDTLAHTLSALAVQLEGANTLLDTEPETARKMIQQSTGIARNGLTEVRRAIQALRATPLENLGLPLALRGAAEAIAEQTGAELSLDLDTSLILSPEVEQTIFRIAEEALNNIARHASASRIEVRLSRDTAGTVTLSLSDNGRGFDPSTARAGHFGLRGIQERVASLSGTLVLTSQPGSGTNILVKFRGDS